MTADETGAQGAQDARGLGALTHQSYHESVRPALPDDVLVTLRLSPRGLAQLRAGMDCRHLRLDAVRSRRETYTLYVETVQTIDAIPAWEAPHSPGFVPAAGDQGHA